MFNFCCAHTNDAMTMKFMSFFSLSLPPSLTLSLFYASRIPAKPPSLAVREKRARNEKKKKTLDNFSTTADGSRASPTITILCHIERNLMGTWKKKFYYMGKKKVIESVSREKEDVSIAIAGRNLT
jgi:hypothetical protein